MQSTDSNKKVQELTVNLLKVFIKICEENDLRYYFTGGSLIGVLRHKGFIPWDDDIDVGMPRRDYEKFLEIVKTNEQEGYAICNRHTDSAWHFAMSQFIDMESEVEINIAEQPRKAHVWIDVFPLDGLPSGKIARWFRVKNILIHRYLVQIAHINTQVDINRKRPLIEKLILKIFKVVNIGKFINAKCILDHLEKVLCKDDFYKSQYVGNMLGRYREKEVVPQNYFGTPKKGEFESIIVNIPEKSHELQTALYGSYMDLPPEDERVAHNVKILKCRVM